MRFSEYLASPLRASPPDYARNYAREPPRRLLQVRRAHDVVPVKHRAGLVARHFHGHALRDTPVDQSPDRRAPEVVPQHRPDLGAPAGPLPRAAEILDPLPPVPPPEVREKMRDDPPELTARLRTIQHQAEQRRVGCSRAYPYGAQDGDVLKRVKETDTWRPSRWRRQRAQSFVPLLTIHRSQIYSDMTLKEFAQNLNIFTRSRSGNGGNVGSPKHLLRSPARGLAASAPPPAARPNDSA